MKNKKFKSLNDYLMQKKEEKQQKDEKIKERSLVEYQKLFNEGKIISKESRNNNKYIFLRLEGDVSKFRRYWIISVDDISEVSQHSEVAKIGYTNNYIIGVSNFKGNVCTIIDMSILLNNKKSLIDSNSCVLLRKNEGIALLWPKIEINNMNLKKIRIEDYKDEPFYEKVGFSKDHYIDPSGNVWNELDVEKLLQSKPIIDGSNITNFI